jgi:hypothetical protein
MSKPSPRRISSTRLLPPGSKRVNHPKLGRRVWLIQGKYYLSRADYLNPPIEVLPDGTRRQKDMSVPE